MSNHRGIETEFEQNTILRLEQLNYQHIPGPDIQRNNTEVVLSDELQKAIQRFYPHLPIEAVEEASKEIIRPDGVDTLRRNKAFHELITKGFELKVEYPDKEPEYHHIYPIDWENPSNNTFHVVNQLPISGKHDRRPDIVLYINGLPLVVFELKNPFSSSTNVEDAFNQIQHYRLDIPQLFEFNALTIISDGTTTLHGMWTATQEWYAPWKSIDGENIESNTTGSMKTLIEGLFPHDRLLYYIRNFILFEVDNDKIIKKGAKYHQFFAVNKAVEKTLQAYSQENEKRIGVIWHTTGSGKSLSMLFLVGILRRISELHNPTFLIEVDRNDLDNQLHDQFVMGRSLVGDVKQAESVNDLRKLLQTQGGEIVFTTIEKFQLKKDQNEIKHPVLSDRSNVIIIADEAHRTQYGFLQGYARYLSEALPNAKRLGFTGTPISLSGADTIEVFGDLIHTYDIKQSQLDGATVPIYYEARQIKLHLSNEDIDNDLEEVTEDFPEEELSDLERKKAKWATIAEAAGAPERMKDLATDLLEHFKSRTSTLSGKAMIVCMTRKNCVRLYDALTALPDCPEVKIVMTSNISKDPPEWNTAGHVTTKAKRNSIKERMKNLDDPLQIVIVCDMWLTGTDIPCLHTLYIDKPIHGHNMIQAISRVNRVFQDKPHGLIVDYIGIGDQLREAASKYSQDGGKGEPAPDISEQAIPLFFDCLNQVREQLPKEYNYGEWRSMSGIDLEDMHAHIYALLTESKETSDQFLLSEKRLSSSYLLVKHLEECQKYADEIICYQKVRKQIARTLPNRQTKKNLDKAIKDLVDKSISSDGVVDIFTAAGLPKADISILDENFLQTYKNKPHENLRLKLLERLLQDEIQLRERSNIARARSFKEMLENTLQRYHNRLIDAAEVIRMMVKIRHEMKQEEERAKNLGLSEEELAFYDAVAENYFTIYGESFLCEMIHDVVQSIKRNLKVDWAEPHRDDIKSAIKTAIKRVLRRRNIQTEHLEPFINRFMKQAEALYKEWPKVA